MIKSILVLFVFLGITLNVNAKEDLVQCKYYNDPHLIPFPLWPGADQYQYLCRNNCTEIMIKNEFVEIIVTADPTGEYPIVEYTLIFFATQSNPQPCVITNSIANPSPPSALVCQNGSPATSTTSGTTQHHYHLIPGIEVEIWQRGNWFNILVTQPFDLVDDSTGVCVEWDCEYERPANLRRKRRDPSGEIIRKIIDRSFEFAKSSISGDPDKSLVQSLSTAVFHDISKTLNTNFAETIVLDILYSDAQKSRERDNYRDNLLKVDAKAEETICKLGKEINSIIEEYSKNCNSDEESNQCLKPFEYSTQCRG